MTFPFEAPIFREAGIDAALRGPPALRGAAPAAGLPRRAPARPVPSSSCDPAAAAARCAARGPSSSTRPARSRRGGRTRAPRPARLGAARSRSSARRSPPPPGLPRSRSSSAPARRRCSVAALTTSGTSTAELSVALVPMVVFYRVSPLARLGKRLFVTTPVVLAREPARRTRDRDRAARLGRWGASSRRISALLGDPARWRAMREGLGEVRARLGVQASPTAWRGRVLSVRLRATGEVVNRPPAPLPALESVPWIAAQWATGAVDAALGTMNSRPRPSPLRQRCLTDRGGLRPDSGTRFANVLDDQDLARGVADDLLGRAAEQQVHRSRCGRGTR